MQHHLEESTSEDRSSHWMRRLAWAAPLFFLIKGILWLLLPLFFASYGFF